MLSDGLSTDFRTNFKPAVHCCSFPRRCVSKQFICHHVCDENQIYSPSAGAVEHIVASFSRNRPKVSHLTRHLHDAMYDMTLLHALTRGNVRLRDLVSCEVVR